jgi:DNA repair protein RadC
MGVESAWRRQIRSVVDSTTEELLECVVGGGTLANRDALAVAADAIDSGRLARCSSLPDHALHALGMPLDVCRPLASVFELARRAALPEPPRTIRRPEDVAAIAAYELGGRTRECVLVVACDAANAVIDTEIVSRGSVDRAPLPVREILTAVLRRDGRAFAVAHNHPADVTATSAADLSASERLASAARVTGLRLLGHVVAVGGAMTAP